MRKIGSLIRIQKWRVDEERRKVADLERLAAEMDERAAGLAREVAAESLAAGRSYEAARGYDAYVRATLDRRAKLEHSRAELETRIAAAREALSEAFEELKRYEITAERAAQAAQAAAARRAQIGLDEMAADRIRRGTL